MTSPRKYRLIKDLPGLEKGGTFEEQCSYAVGGAVIDIDCEKYPDWFVEVKEPDKAPSEYDTVLCFAAALDALSSRTGWEPKRYDDVWTIENLARRFQVVHACWESSMKTSRYFPTQEAAQSVLHLINLFSL